MDFSSAAWFADISKHVDLDTVRIVSALIGSCVGFSVGGAVIVAFLFRVKG
jgi:hypothetical protein